MQNEHDKFIKQVVRSIERLAKKHHIKMWAQEIGKHTEPVEHGATDVTHFVVFSGTRPSEKDIAACEYELPLTKH